MSKKQTRKTSFEEVDNDAPAKPGHNQPGGIAREKLNSIVKRWEKLEEEKQGIAADQRDIMAEAKGEGFDTKIVRACIKLRAIASQEREEYFALLDTYARALGFSILDLDPEKED
jgi:uncharacterized protein (UPF0335 family)